VSADPIPRPRGRRPTRARPCHPLKVSDDRTAQEIRGLTPARRTGSGPSARRERASRHSTPRRRRVGPGGRELRAPALSGEAERLAVGRRFVAWEREPRGWGARLGLALPPRAGWRPSKHRAETPIWPPHGLLVYPFQDDERETRTDRWRAPARRPLGRPGLRRARDISTNRPDVAGVRPRFRLAVGSRGALRWIGWTAPSRTTCHGDLDLYYTTGHVALASDNGWAMWERKSTAGTPA